MLSAQVLVTAWEMMENHSVLPPNPKFLQFLWALAFMQTHLANDTTLLHLLGGSDPKTISKHVWSFIQLLFLLNKVVVSIFYFVAFYFIYSFKLTCLQVFALRFYLTTGRWETLETTVCFWWTEPASGLLWAIRSLFGVTSSRRVVCSTMWVYASKQGIFAGGVGLMPQGSEMP
jgi:hypothetical protein